MSLQELPHTVATGAFKLVRLPLEIANGARERIADRIGGADEQAAASMPTAKPTKPTAPKAAPKPRKPAARTKPKAAAKPKPRPRNSVEPRKPAATKPQSAMPHRTPASKSPTAEQPEVVAEQTEGLEDATDRAIAERRSLR